MAFDGFGDKHGRCAVIILRKSTAVSIALGPFVDAADGYTPETGLTITEADIRIKKNGANWASVSGTQTLSHEEDGWYEASLSAGDTDTEGALVIAVAVAGARPVNIRCMVVAQAVYDALVTGDSTLPVDGSTVWDYNVRTTPTVTHSAQEVLMSVLGSVESPIVTIVSPVSADGDVSIIGGYDYTVNSGQPLEWALTNAPDLTGATVDIVKTDAAETSYGFTVSVLNAGSATQTIRAAVTGAQSAALGTPGRTTKLAFRIKATLSNNAQVALAEGILTIT